MESPFKRRTLRRRFEAKELIQRLKRRPCKDCGKKFHHCQMDFVRADGHAKVPLSRILLRSHKVIAEELGKCDLVCANCGRMRTWGRQRAMRSGPT